MRSRTAFWCAWSLWALSVSTTATALIYSATHPLPASAGNQGNPANGVVAILLIGGFATVGALLVWKRPSNPMGWLLSATSLSYAAGAFDVLLAHFPRTLMLSHWLGWVWFLSVGLTVTFVLLLFPTGSLPSRRWRPVAWMAAAGVAGWVLGNAFAPQIFTAGPPPEANPFGIGGPVGGFFTLIAGAGAGFVVLAGLGAIVSVVVRYRRARLVEREQLKWLVYAAALIVLSLLAQVVIAKTMGSTDAATNLENAVTSGAVAFVPIAIGIAVFRYRLYDIDVVINKTVVYGLLAAFITAVYVAIVVGVGSLLGNGGKPNLGLSILATAVVAVAFQPVRERVQRLANRLVYGKARDALRGTERVLRAHGRHRGCRGPVAAHGPDPGGGNRRPARGGVVEGGRGVPRRCDLAF